MRYAPSPAWHGNGAPAAEPSRAKAAGREVLILEPRLIGSDQFTEGETWGREGEVGADRSGLTAEAIPGRSLQLGIWGREISGAGGKRWERKAEVARVTERGWKGGKKPQTNPAKVKDASVCQTQRVATWAAILCTDIL